MYSGQFFQSKVYCKACCGGHEKVGRHVFRVDPLLSYLMIHMEFCTNYIYFMYT